ncbi:Transglycosylase-like domain-containing protein [Kibdelosporangium aridum]|uniref:Transglycosylase-like domain-containing protein n=1 Tax=Kibdelosporangium aridum TaxID=2030 RepID=A0A1Y5X3U4_KIBAR|nr:Transglycosylase-like domain-containing protein [Kibdelosporangium aridum]
MRKRLVIATFVFGTALAPQAWADPPAGDWARLRNCESNGRYDAKGKYYGAYQFSLETWRSVGGQGHPHLATPDEQDYRALYLYRMRGWSPWGCAKKLKLREDADARSKRVPTYAESAYIG